MLNKVCNLGWAAAITATMLTAAPAGADYIDLRISNVRPLSVASEFARLIVAVDINSAGISVGYPMTIGIYDPNGILRAQYVPDIEPVECSPQTCTSCSAQAGGVTYFGRCYPLLEPPYCACWMTIDPIVVDVSGTIPDGEWVARIDHQGQVDERDELNNDYSFRMVLPCVMTVPTYSSDRFGAMPSNRMQLLAYYDGVGTADLDIHLTNPATNACCVLSVSAIGGSPFTIQEYMMNGFVPTGKFEVRNVVPNGVIDGIAFGLYWRDAAGTRWKLQSRSLQTTSATPNFVGQWPYSWSEGAWDSLMPQLAGTTVDDTIKRRQAQVNLSGAQVLGNGTWGIPTGRVAGDTNGDGCVDLIDLTLILAAFGACCP